MVGNVFLLLNTLAMALYYLRHGLALTAALLTLCLTTAVLRLFGSGPRDARMSQAVTPHPRYPTHAKCGLMAWDARQGNMFLAAVSPGSGGYLVQRQRIRRPVFWMPRLLAMVDKFLCRAKGYANTLAVLWAHSAKQLVAKYPAMCVAAWAYITAAVAMGGTALLFVARRDWEVPRQLLGPLAYWIFVCSVVGYYVVTWATQHLPASQARPLAVPLSRCCCEPCPCSPWGST